MAEHFPADAPEGPVVYFAQMGPYVKIGYAKDLWRRIAGLSLPKSVVVGTLPGDRGLEKELHERFGHCRIDGCEWFHVTPDLEEFIQSIDTIRSVLAPPKPPPSPLSREQVPHRMLHDTTETAALLGVTEAEVWSMLASKQLRYIKIGSLTRIPRGDIDDLADDLPPSEGS